jgi:hypothetical protein
MSIARTAHFMSRPPLRLQAMRNDIAVRSCRLPSGGATAPARHLNSLSIVSRPRPKPSIASLRCKSVRFPNLLDGMQRP